MRVAVANSKRTVSPAVGIGKDGVVLRPLARLGHHGLDRIAPLAVVRGGAVRCDCIGRAVDLDKHEARSVVLLLHEVEARDAGFLDAGSRIFESCLREFRDLLGFDAYVNVSDEQRTTLPSIS